MTEALTDLPDNWVWTTIGEVVDTTRRRVNPKDYPDLPFVGLESIEPHSMRLLGTTPALSMNSSADRFSPGDVLYGRLRPYLNKVFLADFDGLCSGEFIVFRQVESVVSPYLAYFLNSQAFVSFASHATEGDRPRVGFDQLADHPFPLAPLNEQHRIVEAIESYFTRLDAAEAALRRAQARLAQYKSALLKAACEGRLVPTEAELACQEGRAYEPADELLARILKERKANWEAEYPRKTYMEPIEPDVDGLVELPEGWRWVTVAQILAERPANGKSVRTALRGFPVLRLTAISAGSINLAERKIGAWNAKQAAPFLVRYGDFFVSRGNGSIRLVGRCGLVESVPDAVAFPDTMIRLRPHSCVESRFLRIVWESSQMRHQIESSSKTTAGIHKINQQDIQKYVFGLPPLAEQREIVAEAERRLSMADALEISVTVNLARIAHLRQLILKMAFSGGLVQQVENDEPATELLATIEALRTRGGKT